MKKKATEFTQNKQQKKIKKEWKTVLMTFKNPSQAT